MAARGAPRVFRPARAARIDRRLGPRHRRSQNQRRQRARQSGRGGLHHRIRQARRRRLVQRHSEDGLGHGQGGRELREEEPGHLADVGCPDRNAAGRHTEREGDVGHPRDQDDGRPHGGDHPAGARSGKTARHGGLDRGRHALR